MRYYEGTFLILDTELDFSAGNITLAGLEKLGGPEAVKLRLHEETGLILPQIVHKELLSSGQLTLTNWFKLVIDNREKVPHMTQDIVRLVQSMGHTLTDEVADKLLAVPLEADNNRQNLMDKGMLRYAIGDPQAMQIVNRLLLVDDVEYPNKNEMIPMKTEHDKVMLTLADADTILTHQLNTGYNIPSIKGSWARPLPNTLYDYQEIIEIIEAPSPTVRKQIIDRFLGDLTSKGEAGFNLKISPTDLAKIKNGFELLPIEHVIGSSDNDNIPIKENEQEFYDNLISFIKWHIKRFNREVLGNAPDEVLDAKTEEDFNRGELPMRLQEYLQDLITTVLHLQWKFTSNIPYISGDLFDDGEGEDDDVEMSVDDDKELSAVASMDNVRYIDRRPKNKTAAALDGYMFEYLLDVSKTHTAAVWAEALIKLMRWGSNKIKNLSVGKNSRSFFNMLKMESVSQALTDLIGYEVDKDSKGRSVEILGASFVDFKPEGDSFASSYPFVLLGIEEGYLPDSDDPTEVTFTFTLFDIVRNFELGKNEIFDIDFDGEKFVDEIDRAPLTEYPFQKVASSNVTLIRSLEELQDFSIENGVPEIKGTSYAILNHRPLAGFKDSSPLLGRLSVDSRTRTSVVNGAMLSVFQEGATDYPESEINFVDLLNWYYKNIYPSHLAKWNEVFGLNQEKQVEGLNSRNLGAFHLFTGGEEIEAEVEVGEEPFMYPIYEGDQLEFSPIERRKGDGNIIGAYADIPNGRVFASLDEVSQFKVGGETIHLGLALAGMFEAILVADPSNQNMVSRFKVVSAASITNIYKKHMGQ